MKDFREAVRGWPGGSLNLAVLKLKAGENAIKKVTDRWEKENAAQVLENIRRYIETRKR